MIRLVLNADDAGLTPGVSRAIGGLLSAGALTDTSLLACGSAFGEAVEALRAAGVTTAGVHLALVGGEAPVSDPATVPSLVRGGRFRPSWPAVAAAVAAGRIRRADVEREWEAQVERVLASGLAVTHLDGHQHLHLLPRLFPLALSLARRFGVPFVRAPRADDPAAAGSSNFAGAARARLLALFGAAARRSLARAGFPEPPRVLGLAEAGGMTPERWERLLPRLPDDGTWEVVLHPGGDDAETPARYRWGYRWPEESEALRGAGFRALLEAKGAVVASFASLAPRPASS